MDEYDTYQMTTSDFMSFCDGIIPAQKIDIWHDVFMEDFIRNKMATHNIQAHTGKYRYDGTEGEVDILVQAKGGDVIIESKKKSLSKDALKGDDFFIWGDLYDVIYSHMQCARTENGVRNYAPLTITDDKSNTSFSYEWFPQISDSSANNRDRIISKVTLTLTLKEYGPMQDMMLMSNITLPFIVGFSEWNSFSTSSASQTAVMTS